MKNIKINVHPSVDVMRRIRNSNESKKNFSPQILHQYLLYHLSRQIWYFPFTSRQTKMKKFNIKSEWPKKSMYWKKVSDDVILGNRKSTNSRRVSFGAICSKWFIMNCIWKFFGWLDRTGSGTHYIEGKCRDFAYS